jgi:Mrp family chromosome partitioning ATPase
MSKIFDALRKAEQEPNPLAARPALPVLPVTAPHPRDRRVLDLEFGRLSSAVQSLFPKARSGKVVLVVGCVEREGATYVSGNLARVLAQTTGEPVLCVDGNFHDPALTRSFQGTDALGLSDIYQNGRPRDVAPLLRTGDASHLYMLGTGRTRLVPGAFYDSPEFDALLASFRRTFRFVLIDGAPLLKHPDSIHLAARSDGVLLVVRCRHLKREVVRKGIEMVESVHAPILGAVLNRRKFAIPTLIYKLIS